MYPGETEFANRERNLETGIDVPDDLRDKLLELAMQNGIEAAEEYFTL